MADILVRNVPPEIVDILKRKAARHRRSLQQELLLVLEEAATRERIDPVEAAARVREQLAGYGRKFSDSTALIREDRER